ncbi:hypothetical protein H7Q97_15390 [Ochrobactrum sp. CM-21-5]|nr:VirK family protein [Ochrobactrum sp. CM-21-5]MBC2886772.1 hypothetical protein [Ochrobactrum sp. CM-21-5]
MYYYLPAFVVAFNLVPAMAVAMPATQFDRLRDELFAGKSITSIVDLNQCKQESGPVTSNIKPIGGFTIGAFQVLPEPEPQIAYAHKHFTVMPDGTPVIEFVQFRVMLDDTVTLTVRRLSPTTFHPLSEPRVFMCVVEKGLRFVRNDKKSSVTGE